MAYEFIKLEKSERIATLMLNRPAKMNALSAGLLTEFGDALDDVHNDHDINVLILTGAGRAFSAGYDISPGQEAADIPATAAWDAKHLPARTLMKLWHLRQPTIAAVNGHALAAGNVLAMTADIVIAADNATFGEPEIRFVAHSPAIMLPFMIPLRHLHWLYYTGDTVDAHTAEKWNMVNWVVPAGELMDSARKAASRIANVPPYAVQMMKRSIKGTYEKMGFSEAFEHHLMIRMIEAMAPDVPEKEALEAIKQEHGMRAFLEARDAPFR
jgi:enoyl-CoA hydratase/carnithine racemase